MKSSTRKTVLALVLSIGLMAGLVARSSNLFAEEEDIRLQYKVGEGLFIGNGDNLVHLQGRTQARFTFTGMNGSRSTDSFSVPRAEIRIDGHTLERKLKYGFEMNLATRAAGTTTSVCSSSGTAAAPCPAAKTSVLSSTTGLAVLNDYYVDWVPTAYFGLQVGQFKVPFLIQQLTSSTKQQFVDRSSSTTAFDLGRDIGMNVHGALFDKKMNYAVFFMNGDGANSLNRDERALMAGTRVEFPILGEYAYSESDVSNSDTPNLGVGIAYAFNQPATAPQGNIPTFTKMSEGTLDVGYKYKGFSFQGAGMFSRAHEVVALTNWGYNAQVGYFLIPKILEVAVREGGTVFSGATINQYEHAMGVNYFVKGKGHGIKFQLDSAILRNSRATAAPFTNDYRTRLAMNLIF
ncbi:MAG: hypothetical protein HY073_04840 [Deltaproteobacteria bacterium]|nr:hypothetical protein [Deltaproteobacteria bacterium]